MARLSIAHSQSDFGRVLTVSVGLSTAQPAQAGSADALLIAADLALYQAKENGRNRIADERIDAGISS